jgi:hypothetical protein
MAEQKQTWAEWFYTSLGLTQIKQATDYTSSNAAEISETARRTFRDFCENRSGVAYQPTLERGDFTQVCFETTGSHFLKAA